MHAMMNSPRRGMIALVLAGMALLLVVGIAVAAASGGGENGNQGAAEQPRTTPTATATGVPDAAPPSEPAAEPMQPAPAGSVEPVRPDSPVSATPSDPSPKAPEPTPNLIGAATLPISNLLPLPDGTVRAEAPIDGLDILVMESYPPQYGLHIQAGLPSGCAKEAGYEASRSGNVITVKIYNSMPADPVPCTMIYGMYNISLNLGGDYTPGETYTVVVNDQSTTFTAQ